MRDVATPAQRDPVARPGRDWGSLLARHGALAALVLLIVFNALVTPNFLTWQTLNVNLTQVCTTVIVGVGMTLVIATGGVDLSVGSLMAIAGALAPLIFLDRLVPGLPFPLALALAFVAPVLVTGALGWFNGWLITRFRIQPIIATLVLFIAGRGIAQVMTNGNLQVFHIPDFQFIGLGRIAGVPFQAILMMLVVAAAAFAVRARCSAGRSSPLAAMSARPGCPAYPSRRVKRRVYGFPGFRRVGRSHGHCAQFGVGRQPRRPRVELDAIAAAAVAERCSPGAGRRERHVVGALIIQLVRYTLLANGVPDSAAIVAKAA